MKAFFTTLNFLMIYVLNSIANDTLTRASVWNFSINDTFDFRTTVQSNAPIPQGTFYKRFVVTNISYTPNNDSLIIEIIEKRNHSPLIISEIVIDRLDSQEIFIISKSAQNCSSTNIILLDSSNYLGRKENRVTYSCFEAGWDARYVEGLGEVYNYSVTGDPYLIYSTEELIYYSKGNEKWGNKISDNLLLSGAELSNENSGIEFKSYLDSETSVLNIYLSNEPSNYYLTIIDATGRKVKALSLKDEINSVSIIDLQSGIYFAQLSTSSNATIKKIFVK